VDYCRARWLLSDNGICDSIAFYDSSQDGRWVASNKHWLAFISGEGAPLSDQFNVGGVDPMPRDMDDSNVPISAQSSEEADVVYYGEHRHNGFTVNYETAMFIANQIASYIFGGSIQCSVLAQEGAFEHEAGWLPITYKWQEKNVGEVFASSGHLIHTNESYIKWQEWEDVVGICSGGAYRSSFRVRETDSLPLLTSIEEARWLTADNSEDCRLYVRTRAAPRMTVGVDWEIYRQGLLPEGTERMRYEVEISTGTPFTEISGVFWASDNPRDIRLNIQSEADGPFRFFEAGWRTYYRQGRFRKIIDEIP
jgi:hypothetical protein